MDVPEPDSSTTAEPRKDYTNWSQPDLISRVTALESQLRTQHAQLSTLLAQHASQLQASSASLKPQPPPRQPKAPPKPFNFSKHPTRLIALKFSYLGAHYNGYEHANGTLTPLPTVEEVLWKALRKARLIDPLINEGADVGYDVVWNTRDRLERYGSDGERLEVTWDGCEYSKCGRTDRGVSAFGQVVGIRARSRVRKKTVVNGDGDEHIPPDHQMPLDQESSEAELPYADLLNSVLPSHFRILAVCYTPPPDFDARFSCIERHYRYFFTNPSFPGCWLDIDSMRVAAQKLEGLHDFRNFCKVDASKGVPGFVRRIRYASVEEAAESGDAGWGVEGGKTYAFVVHGSAFLWHQVRCMVAVLFLVGQGLEAPEVIDRLLAVEEERGRPEYLMADERGLVLWDCRFGKRRAGGEHGGMVDEDVENGDQLNWTLAGDKTMATSLALSQSKKATNGLGGLIDESWAVWNRAKMDEVLARQLLGMVAGQNEASDLRNGNAENGKGKEQSTKIFDGGERGRNVGQYVPIMAKPRMESAEEMRRKYVERKERGRELKGKNGGRKEDPPGKGD